MKASEILDDDAILAKRDRDSFNDGFQAGIEFAAATDLLASAKECREVLASLMRSLYVTPDPDAVIDAWEADLKRLGIPEGFGVRIQTAIATAEGKE